MRAARAAGMAPAAVATASKKTALGDIIVSLLDSLGEPLILLN